MFINLVKKNFYRDSVFLMNFSNQIKSIQGVIDASVMMGTPANKKLLTETGFLTKDGEAALANDLLVCLNAAKSADLKAVQMEIERRLISPESGDCTYGNSAAQIPDSIEEALSLNPDANMALISIPGAYVRYQAEKLINAGINVMIFSDNVSVEDEVSLKKAGLRKRVLVMGPDCGTAIINDVPLGFANVIRKGAIGIVGASGTGIQEVSSLIHKNGAGITHAIGTGGRDVSSEVGGLTLLHGIKLLEKDSSTKIICIVSKPPAMEVEKKVIALASKSKKPFVINFLGSNSPAGKAVTNVTFASTLEDSALQSVSVLKHMKPAARRRLSSAVVKKALREKSRISGSGKYVRGLFSGGTLCEEAIIILGKKVKNIYSNISKNKDFKLKDSKVSVMNSFIDLGEDEFTRGVPHPMIDFTVRNKRLIQEASDKNVGVILLDIVLGYGAHFSPAAAIKPAIEESLKIARRKKREIVFVASICGTDLDPQNYELQKQILEDLGVNVLASNAEAAGFTEVILNG